jgi:hypothetical protein
MNMVQINRHFFSLELRRSQNKPQMINYKFHSKTTDNFMIKMLVRQSSMKNFDIKIRDQLRSKISKRSLEIPRQ